jgi:hypothetical protein
MRARLPEQNGDDYNLKKSGVELSENSPRIRRDIEAKARGKANDSFNPGC